MMDSCFSTLASLFLAMGESKLIRGISFPLTSCCLIHQVIVSENMANISTMIIVQEANICLKALSKVKTQPK